MRQLRRADRAIPVFRDGFDRKISALPALALGRAQVRETTIRWPADQCPPFRGLALPGADDHLCGGIESSARRRPR